MGIHHSPSSPVNIPDVPFTEYMLEHAGRFGDKPAFIDGVTGETVRYDELGPRISAIAAALAAEGVGKGDAVCMFMPNHPLYALGCHATALLGAAVSPANPTYTARELAHQLKDSRSKLVVTVPGLKAVVEEAAAAAGVSKIHVVGEAGCALEATVDDATAPPKTVDIDVDSHLASLPYSSGTTGLPKGVMLTHKNLVANIAMINEGTNGMSLGYEEHDVVLGLLPAFHIYGKVVINQAPLRHGSTVVTLPRFEPDLFLATLQDYKVTFAPLVPPLVLFMAKHPMVAGYDLSSIDTVFSGAAPLDAELEAAAAQRLPKAIIRQGYGMTELSPVSHFVPSTGAKTGSIGFTVASTESRIVDPETMEPVKQGERGELQVRGPQVMAGYLNNEKATKETILPDGYLRTGDLAYADEEGYIFVVDRLKELIKSKGFQVAPAELEALLLTHKDVADVCVVPVADDRSGQLPKAFVVLAKGAKATGEDLSAWMKPQVAPHKLVEPQHFSFISEIPKSASGKILRRVLRDK